MNKRISESHLLRPQDLKPLCDNFKVIGVFIPGAVKVDDELAGVAEKPRDHRPGFMGLPRWEPNGKVVVDWASEDELERSDPGVVRRKPDNLVRLTSISHLRVFRSPDSGSMEWTPGSVLLPTPPIEEFGLEDPRIVEIDET